MYKTFKIIDIHTVQSLHVYSANIFKLQQLFQLLSGHFKMKVDSFIYKGYLLLSGLDQRKEECLEFVCQLNRKIYCSEKKITKLTEFIECQG